MTPEPGIVLRDSVTATEPGDAGAVLVTGSHGGVYAANLAARARVRAANFNDAGPGKDKAGIAGLAALQDLGMAAAGVVVLQHHRALGAAADEDDRVAALTSLKGSVDQLVQSRPEDARRRGGPYALLTNRALFGFDRARGRFHLQSVHPGHDLDEVIANTGFAFDRPATVPETPRPDAETLALIRGPVAREIARTYPRFAARLFPEVEAVDS